MENGSVTNSQQNPLPEKSRCVNGVSSGTRTGTNARKLVLHFDVRNTVLVADSVTNVNVDDALNSYLTGVTWGRESTDGWEWFSQTPSLNPPVEGAITYYKHLERQLVKTPSDRAILRKATGKFTQKPIGERYLPYFVKHLKYLEWPFPDVTDTLLTMTGSTGKLYHYMLPSFFNLIHHLHDNNREFAIVFRTYGMDAPTVLQCTQETLKGRHPGFPNPLPIHVNVHPGRLQRSRYGMILENATQDGMTKSTYTSEREIFDLLNQSTGVCGYVDDFPSWQENDYSHHAGKPLWVDLTDSTTQHILFDDNIRVSDKDSIVDLRVFDPKTGTGTSLSKEKAAKFEDACLVQADLLQSTADPNYFIDKLNLCEHNYDKLLHPKINGIW